MEREITDADRTAMVRLAVSRVGRDEIKGALVRANDPSFQAPSSVTNALKALRRHRDPAGVVTRPQYRAALPYLAALVSDACLSRTIEALGDHSDDPTREQLLVALEEVRESFPDTTVGVMLASVADADMPASDLCFELAATDGRFGLGDWADPGPTEAEATAPPVEGADGAGAVRATDRADRGTTPEQREARRVKKQKDAEERRRKQEVARQAGEQVRKARKKERSGAGSRTSRAAPAVDADRGSAGSAGGPTRAGARGGTVAPRLTRRAALTPLEEQDFDRADPWVGAVVFAWVPFDAIDPDRPDVDGKSRRCVVVAGSSAELLVRPGYSEGGVKSRDWKSVPLRHWKRAGFDQPTWVDSETLRVPRPADGSPVGWLEPEDWNSLW